MIRQFQKGQLSQRSFAHYIPIPLEQTHCFGVFILCEY